MIFIFGVIAGGVSVKQRKPPFSFLFIFSAFALSNRPEKWQFQRLRLVELRDREGFLLPFWFFFFGRFPPLRRDFRQSLRFSMALQSQHGAAWLLLILISISISISAAAAQSNNSFFSSSSWGWQMRASVGTMVVPLVLSSNGNFNDTNVAQAHSELSWRQQRIMRRLAEGDRKLPSARMKLYDELLANGYYTTRLWIGTPSQEFSLIVDSGSTVTYVPCSTCTHCGNHQDPKFQPDSSSTYVPVKCGLDCSNCDIEKNQCKYDRQYAEMSSSSGVLGEDLLSFGHDSGLSPQRAVFGCENSETGDIYNQLADGIIGLGRGQLSIMDQLVQKGVIADSFSLCYGGMDVGGGAMVLGAIDSPPDMVFSKSDPNRSPYYNIQLKGIRVAGELLPLNSQIFNGRHGTVLDSGTTYAYLPEPAFIAFRESVIKHLGSLKKIPGPDPSYHDLCFAGAGSNVSQLHKSFPAVDFVFGSKRSITLSPENYLFRHSKVHGAYCLGIFQNGKDLTTLLGGIVVRNILVTYDRGNQRIGFWKTNCSELRERLQGAIPSPPPPPAAPPVNSTDPSHALPPSQSPAEFNLDEHEKIGGIEVLLSLTLSADVFKTMSSDFKSDMARELYVSDSQITILNATNIGDALEIGLAVYPPASKDSLTNSTVEKMLTTLTRKQLHLRDGFGTYRMLSWRLLPPLKRTWIRRHWAAVLGGIAGVLSISSALVIYWHFRNQKLEALGTYKTVEAANQEQELQQL